MRIVAIDASPHPGIVSRSVEQTARAAEDVGAEVVRVRLAHLSIHSCIGCGWCRYNGVCKLEDDIPNLAEEIDRADGVIFGLPGYFRKPDPNTEAVIARVQRFFPEDRQMVLPGVDYEPVPARRARAAKRAVIITACRTPEPLATFFGYTTGPIRELRRALNLGGIRTVGSLAIAGTWAREPFDEWERDKAASLGRMLAGKV